jgi:hypothetical protein
MRHLAAAVLLVILAWPVESFAGDTPLDRETLRGLAGVGVVVEDLGTDAKADGLTEEQIQTDVESIVL